MKAAAGFGLTLAFFFGILALVAVNDLSDEGEVISGLAAPIVSLFNVLPSLMVIFVGVLGIGVVAGAYMLLRNR